MADGSGFFEPLWRRVAIVAACPGWAGVEWFYGETVWAGVAAAATAYGAWTLLIAHDGTKHDTK